MHKKLTVLITELFQKSGFKEFKFKKEINFNELYNLATDPNETKNMATTEAATATRLKNAALAWWKSLP